MSMYEDGIDGDSLMEVVARSVKHIDVGAAVLPKPLFKKDIDEKLIGDESSDEGGVDLELDGDDDNERNSGQIDLLDGVGDSTGGPPVDVTREGRAPEYYDVSPRIPTRYAKTLRREFNAVGTFLLLRFLFVCLFVCSSSDNYIPTKLNLLFALRRNCL